MQWNYREARIGKATSNEDIIYKYLHSHIVHYRRVVYIMQI